MRGYKRGAIIVSWEQEMIDKSMAVFMFGVSVGMLVTILPAPEWWPVARWAEPLIPLSGAVAFWMLAKTER